MDATILGLVDGASERKVRLEETLASPLAAGVEGTAVLGIAVSDTSVEGTAVSGCAVWGEGSTVVVRGFGS